jgi:hypothetical protein
MISLHAGRLLLFCDRADRTWHCRVNLGPRAEHQLEADTGTIQLQEALLRAQRIYQAAVLRIRPASSPRMCWDCLQWEPARKACTLGFPEARQTGGRFAARCDIYVGADDPRPQ